MAEGGANTVFAQTESLLFIQEALSRGIGVVALDSYDRFDKAWNESLDPQQNIDLQRTAALRRALIAEGRMGAEDPVYVLGASNGGVFASLFDYDVQAALDFPVAAAALYISSGDFAVMQTTTVPTVFALAENDDATDPAITAFNSLATRGIPAQMWINPSRPLHSGSFWRIKSLTLEDSETIFGALADAGIIDSNGYVTSNPKDDSRWEAFVPTAYSSYLKFPIFPHATRSITAAIKGFRAALPLPWQSIPKPWAPRSLARARRRSPKAYSVRLAVA
jgi:hypothetical protein